MKRLIAVFLLLSTLALCACDGAAPTDAPTEPPTAEVSASPAPEAAAVPVPETTAAPASSAEPAAAPEPTPDLSPLPDEWFDDAVFFGDSVTVTLGKYCLSTGDLGMAQILGGYSFSMQDALDGLEAGNASPAVRGLGHLTGQQWTDAVLSAFDRLFEEKEQIQQSGAADIAKEIRTFVAEHYMEDIHLTTLAERFHYSPSYLSRLYKKVTGDSLTGVINSQRIVHARFLLEHTALPVAEVARQSGFYSTKYFLQLFKKKTGITPSQYRKKPD